MEGRKEKPLDDAASLFSVKPPKIITSPSVIETSVSTSLLIKVGELLTPVVVLTKLDNCCDIDKSTIEFLTFGCKLNIVVV